MYTESAYPLTEAQKRIWYTERFYPGTSISNIGGNISFKTEQPYDAELMKQALNHYVRLHDTMRLRMINDPGSEPAQYVSEYKPFEVEIIDFSNREKEELEQWASDLMRLPMPFFDANLYFFAITKTGEYEGSFLIKMNHILSDGNGMVITISEIIDIYLNLVKGRAICEESRPSYLAYIPSDTEYKQSDRWLKDKQFWDNKFSTLPEFISLKPADSYSIRTEAEREIIVIPQVLERQIRAFCQANNLSILTLFLSVLYTYCYRITGHEDLVLGTFFANRTSAKEKALPGMFVSTTPVRVQMTLEMDFLTFARFVLKEQTGVLRHQKYPYNMILSDIKARKPDVSSLFGLTLEYIVMGWQEKDGISYVAEQLFCGHELNDMFVSVKDRWDTGELQMVFDYRTEMFTHEEIQNISRHMVCLLRDAVLNPSKSLCELDICPPEDRQLILEQFNDTDALSAPGLTAIALFEMQAKRLPAKTAVKFGDNTLTYHELNERANRLARLLVDKGVSRDGRVAILMDRKPLMLECILAIWKAGGAYVPVDPDYPNQRIRDMISDSGASCVLTESFFVSHELQKQLPDTDFLLLDERSSELLARDSSNLDIAIIPEQLAYVIYTSGSTGKPKGAMLEHAGMLNHIEAMVEELKMDEACIMAQNAPHCFDISVWQFAAALTLGGTTVIYPNELILNPRAFIAEIEQDGVTVLEVVVSFLSALLEMELDVSLAALGNLLVTGEAAKADLARLWFERYPHVKLINAYGPTEACDDITLHIMEQAPEGDVMPIGKPVRNLKVYVVDGQMNLLPIGVIGELCVSGIGVGRGYLNDAERTAKVFLNDPFRSGSSVRLYRTGDLARWLPDGSLAYMGRIDHQVKIRGHRIECGDIEARLQQHEAIKEVLVLDRSDSNGSKYLCAYFTGMWELASAELRAFISSLLPSYMVPSYFVQLEAFPLTANGKIDRRALPEPAAELGGTAAEYAAPRSDAELQLANIWQSVLGIERIGIRDNFFELGGDSLKAMVIMANLYKQRHVELPLRELFEAPTIEGLALRLSRYLQQQGARPQTIVPIQEQEYYEVSSAQKRMFLLQLMEEESTAYNLPGMLTIEGPLDADRVRHSLNMLVQRHEALRTSFVVMDGVPLQRVLAQLDLEVPMLDASVEQLPLVAREFIRPFDLYDAPLLRVLLVRLGEKLHALFVDMHHIISDGVSVQLFLQQFGAYYSGARLPALEIQYKDFSAWQNRKLRSEATQSDEHYWLQQLSGELPVLAMPTDYPRPSVQSFAGARNWFHADAVLTDAIRKLAADTGTTPFMVMFAAYQALLFKYTWQEDLIVGTPIAGRSVAEVEQVFGMFVNTLSIRSFPEENKTFLQFLQELKGTLFEAYEHQNYPFDAIVEKLALGRDSSRNPLFDAMFVHMNNDIVEMEIGGLQLKVNELDEDIAKFDLLLEASEQADHIRFKLQYCRDLFKQETMDRLSVHYLNLLAAVTSAPETTLGSTSIISSEEKHLLLYGLHSAKADYPQTATIVALFEEQAAKTPDHIAVAYDGQALTYRELNAQANRLARTLRERGVSRNSLVAILVERSEKMIIGLLAIIKAGGAYVPIDPAYPADRIAFTLKDSGALVLLTESAHLKKIEAYNGIAIDMQDEACYGEETSNLPLINEPDDLLYIIYTSGTTGLPKGVMITHRNVVRLLAHDRLQFEFGESDVWTLFHSYCFDFSVWEMYGALLFGGKTVIVPKHVAQNSAEFAELLRKERVTVLNQTPTAFYALIHDELKRADQELCIRYVIFGGEALSPAMLQPWREKYPNTRLINMYGITETTVHVTFKEIGDAEIAANISNIGKPIATLTAYILDKNKQLAPVGVVGELYIGGDGVALGYLNREELTAERFIMNPHVPGERIYRSGDLARMMPNGEMEYLGRIDHQVKIRGYRIELGEIESAILQVPNVREAAVVVSTDAHNQKILVAYYITEYRINDQEIRKYLSEHLPSYMIPSFFVELERMPLTSNGKLDRGALPAPQRSIAAAVQLEPRTPTEAAMVEIWKELLGAETIGVQDDFFHSGGHSLSAAMLAARILAAFHVKIPLRMIFKQPTIAEISALIDEAVQIEKPSGAHRLTVHSRVETAPVQDEYPLSSAQKRLFVLDRLEGAQAGTAYNLPAAIRITGQLNHVRLEQAFAQTVRRHESLRTSFRLENGNPVQRIHEDAHFAIHYISADEADIPQTVQQFIRPFDLSEPTLLRVCLAALSEDQHLLLVDMHHIISDGVSVAVIIDELIRGYAAEELPAPRLQYKDYAVWQQSWIDSEDYRSQEQYWLHALSGELPVLELSCDYTRPPVQSFEGESFSFEIDAALTERLTQLAAASGTTMYMLLLAAYKVLLFKYSGSEDVIVGTPVANRTHADVNDMIGMFVNTLAIRSYPSAEQTFNRYLQQVKDSALAAFEHQNYPFEELLDKLAIRRDLSRNPIFDTMFSLNNVETVELAMDGVAFQTLTVEEKISKFDISVEALEKDGKIAFTVEYCTRLFREATARRFAGHFSQILEAVAMQPDIQLALVPLLTDGEKEQIIHLFNFTAMPSRQGATAISLFEEQAQRVPDRIAVSFGEERLTYSELNLRANQLARLLMEKGIGRDDRVAIFMDRKPRMVECILAIWKAGGAYVPVDPAYPLQRIADMILGSQAEIVLTESLFCSDEVKSVLPGAELISLDVIMDSLDSFPSSNVALEVKPEQLAYVLYTSGSTGKPKGAMLEHAGMLNHIEAMIEELKMKESCVMAQNAPHCFDISVWQFVTALTIGGKTVIYPDELISTPKSFISAVAKDGVTVLEVVVSFMSALLEMDLDEKLPALEHLIITGEAAKAQTARQWFERYPHIKLVNAYGPTEAADDVTLHILDRAPESDVMPIGKPVRNMRVYITDPHMNLLPIGVVGELCVSGIGVGRGYLNDPARTDKAFMKDPFHTEFAARLYRTGDLARWLPDGSLEYRGRIDHQVKIRGHRIECGEIEVQLLEHEAIKQVLVMDRSDSRNQKYLCAYFTADRILEQAELKELIASALPSYMVPSYFVQMDVFPLTPNGKVDRKALPAPSGDLLLAEYKAPSNEDERMLAEIWEDVLGVDRIGVMDHFFELGGHSLKAMVILSHVSSKFGTDIPLRELFASPTIEGLAQALKARGAARSAQDRAIPIARHMSLYPLSSEQKRLYILSQFEEGGSTSYHMSDALRIEGPLDHAKWLEAFRSIVRRHEILRTSFHSVDGEPFQKVHGHIELEMPVRAVEEHEVNEIVQQFVRPFHLDEPPLLRVELLKLSELQHILLIDMHHIVSDGESIRLLVDEFMKLYSGAQLPELKVQYKDFAVWQQERHCSDVMERQEDYWLNQFADGELPVLQLPTDYARPPVQSFEGDRFVFEAGEELLEELRSFAQDTGTTMYMLLLTAYYVLLSKYSGQQDIVIGTPVAGRTHVEVLNLAGMFVNTLAIRSKLAPGMSFLELLDQVKGATLEAFENQEYPFEELVDKLQLQRDFSRNPLFDTMFSHQMSDTEALVVNELTFVPYGMDNPTSKFDLSLDAVEMSNALHLEWEYSTKLFKRETIERAALHYMAIVKAAAADPQLRIEEIDYLSAEEKRQLLAEFNDTQRDYQTQLTFHELFALQAEQTPEHPAVTAGGISLTYLELDTRANRVAHALRGKGVAPESIVGVMVDRSVDMIVAALGVMKAGAAYLPIDSEYPKERIAYLLQDSQASVVITQRGQLESAELTGNILVMEEIEEAGGDGSEPISWSAPHHLAYIIYTSGTTGKPKGVMIEHRQYMNVALAWKEKYELEQFPVKLLQMASFSFDVFAGDMARALLSGGELIICPNDVKLDPASLYELMLKHKINIFESTPSLIAPLMQHIYENGLDVSFLKLLILGADSCPIVEFHKLLSRFGTQMRIINSYGVTEASIDSSYYEASISELPAAGNTPIGKPLPNMSYYVLDSAMKLLPVGVAGELYIGGAGVARGYFGREDLTAEKFVANPFISGDRLYRTGDLATWMQGGNLMFLGRDDHQVKVRGYRIELGEIEACLLKHPDIREAIVMAHEDAYKQKYLCAYIVSTSEPKLNEIQAHLIGELPVYMVPSQVVLLEQMPLTPNGKIDRKALPELAGSQLKSAEYAAPSTPAEKRLAEVMELVLGTTGIGVNDDFFQIGGHSLKAMTLVSHIHKAFGIAVPLRMIFEAPTIAMMGRHIDAAEESSASKFMAIQPIEWQETYELSSVQKRLYILNQFEGTGTSYNMPDAMIMEGHIDPARVEAALRTLIQRHESLRTSFHMQDGKAIQQVHHAAEFHVELSEALHAPDEELEQLTADFVRPFDLGQAPLMRAALVKLSEDRYLFLFDVHHIVSDGVSMGIILSEFAALYGGEALPELKLHYKDFAAWQNRQFTAAFLKEQEAYWLECLSGELPVLELPTDYPRPARQSFEGARVAFGSGIPLRDELNRLAAETGTTLYMVLFAAFNVLLAKYSGQSDLIVGTATAGRSHADLEGIVGMFVGTLALRTEVNAGFTFRDLLASVKARMVQAYEHQHYPFDQLVEKLQVKQDLSRNPVFNTMFILQNTDEQPFQLENVKLSPFEAKETMTKFDLTLEATETQDDLAFVLEYSSKLFSPSTAQRMSKHLIELIRSAVQQPDVKLSELRLLSREEEHRLIHAFNDTATVYDTDAKLLHELVESQARRTPELPAIIAGQASLTYKEWNGQANRLARTLRAKGAGPDRTVAILANRSIEMTVAILAVLKSGSAYVPIDPDYPQDRIRYMLEDSGSELLLTQGEIASDIFYGGQTIDLLDSSCYSEDDADLKKVNSPEHLAYVIYTSGTTGRPKGVMIEHRSIVNTIAWRAEEYRFSAGDRVLQILSYAFDAFAASFFAPMAAGGASVIAMDEEAKDPLALKGCMTSQQITHFSTVPSLYAALLEMLSEKEAASLKAVTLGGEHVPVSMIEKSIALNDQLTLFNEYGPTESSVITTAEKGLLPGKKVTIGRPIANTRVYIVDEHMKLQPVGVYGELCIAGAGLARGYFNQPEMTAAKFVAGPFASGERIYRTGDLARWLEDGTIDFAGRLDNQVKIRGYRIELGEIEAHLMKLDMIKEAAVIARDDDSGQKYLCAYIVSDDELAVLDVRASMAQELPGYMVPAYFIQLSQLPLTPNGKLDPRALPAPDLELLGRLDYAAPSDELEEKVAAIVQDLLQLERVGMADHFFMIGGQSLKAMQLVAQLYRAFNAEVPLRVIFESVAIRDIADFVRKSASSADLALQPVQPRENYPLSSAQKRLYVLDQLEGPGTGYNMPGVLRLKGALNRSKLEDSFQQLVNRHESLRTSFQTIESELVQIVHKAAALQMEWMVGEEAEAIASIESFVRPFDLSEAPLLRVGLLKLSDEEHLLLFDMHHIVSDGISMNVLIQEFTQLYRGEEPAELKIQYKDFALWQHGLFEAGVMSKQEAYWTERFAGEIPALELATDFPRPAVRSLEGDYYDFEADGQLLRELKELASDTGTTLFMVLLAAYNVLLAKYTNQNDIVVGTPIAGRTHGDTEGLIGMFVSTLPMRNRPESGKTFLHFLNEVKQHAYEAYDNQDYPFESMVEKLQPYRDLSRNPLFDTVFILQNMDQEVLEMEQMTIEPFAYENKISKFDLTLAAVEEEDGLSLSWEYGTSLFRSETMERMSKHFIQTLREITRNPGIALAQIDMLDSAEKEQMLVAFNAAPSIQAPAETLHGLFELQAGLIPKQIALSLGSEHMTYEELNKRANRLARTLRERGVEAESVVGIMANRSFEMIVGMLAVLKAGGAYMPIDPAYPAERIAFMLENSEAEFVLSQAEWMKAAAHGTSAVWLDLCDASLYAIDGSNLSVGNRSSDLAYIIYTSGTTGKPKGVMIEHRSIAGNIWWRKEAYGLSASDRVLQLFSFAFDGFVTSFYTPIVSGSTVILLEEDEAKDPVAIKNNIVEHGVTHFISVPSLYAGVLECLSAEEAATLRMVTLAGERVTDKVIALSKSVNDSIELINEYGPTESSVVATIERDLQPGCQVTIGRPISGTSIRILGADGQMMPIGAVGELCIAGAGLARGYLRLPEMTDENFVADAYQAGARLYRTGDAARFLPDGRIDYIGRIDDQVKVRGYRIELGEIEGALLQLARVKETVVVARDDDGSGKYLCAYVTAEDESEPAALRDELSQLLPDYMLPAFIVLLDRLPVTANGKVDRRALPAPDRTSSGSDHYQAPVGDKEQILALIWQELLGVERVGTRDHFFQLGGDSIKAIQAAARLNKHGLRFEVRDLFRYPTIAELSPRLKLIERTISQAAVEGEVPLTPIQHWFFENSFTDQHYWNQTELIYRQEGFDADMLHLVFHKLTQHHDALRLRFDADSSGKVKQRNEAAGGEHFSLEQFDLRGQTNEQIQLALLHAAAKIQSSMNLADGPLVKLGLFVTDDGDHLLITIHHLVVDGVSWRILFEDLEEAYRQAELGQTIVLPDKTDSYRYWAEQLSSYAGSEQLRSEAAYWEKLGQTEIVELPKDRHSSDNRVKHMRSIGRELSEEATGKLLKGAHEAYRTEMNDLLMAALALALKDWSNGDTFAVNLEGHGREAFTEKLDITRTVGWFTSQFPVILETKQAGDLGYLIKLTKEMLRKVPNKGLGYGILKFMSDMRQRFELEPEISFNYLGQFGGDSENGSSMSMSSYDSGLPFSRESERTVSLDVTGLVYEGKLKLELHYSEQEYEAATAEGLIDLLLNRLLEIIEHCVLRETQELTPSDLGDGELTLEDLDSILESIEL
ncbi:non-ribosomal peptide synthase/polyketide synthase [Paenibacillus sp. FJAT-27812]|uniref:non-ribosomal peptide synthase/polyketide synthase n=1 Tax=Paenibacillus sp. FJAT-27812 TaxID=1684143 RepID=UPI0006A78FDF|nr:non-ribosomal peptide synthetase [Paenibacillus sp. FJAT-27812]